MKRGWVTTLYTLNTNDHKLSQINSLILCYLLIYLTTDDAGLLCFFCQLIILITLILARGCARAAIRGVFFISRQRAGHPDGNCPHSLGGVARPLEDCLNGKPCRVRGAQCSARRRTRQGAKRRGYTLNAKL